MCNLLERPYSFGYNSAPYPGKAQISQPPPPRALKTGLAMGGRGGCYRLQIDRPVTLLPTGVTTK